MFKLFKKQCKITLLQYVKVNNHYNVYDRVVYRNIYVRGDNKDLKYMKYKNGYKVLAIGSHTYEPKGYYTNIY